MTGLIRSLLLFLVVLTVQACGPDLPAPVAEAYAALPETLDYNFDVKPILSDKCFACHGPDAESRYGDLRLDLAADDEQLSLLTHRILSTDPEIRMPPPESNLDLSDRERAVLIKWVEQGAEVKKHWSLLPRHLTEVPEDVHPIDHFVGERLGREGLGFSGAAEPTLLSRRAALTLTGLPLRARHKNLAYEDLLDTLLAAPAYGERMAAHWLDVARYADSDGYLDDKHRRLWPYRDWVIRSFNENLPYDDFVTHQLAGDLLPDANQETTLATAFNRLHQKNSEAGIVYEEYRVEYVADRTLTLGKAFMGISLECAQCHDHKYDPISQEDYFSAFAMFNSTAEMGTAVYGPGQTPGPSLMLTSERQDSIIGFLERMIAEKEQDLAEKEDLPDPGKPDHYVSFEPIGVVGDQQIKLAISGSKTGHATPTRADFGEGRRGQALYWGDGMNLHLPDSIGWYESYEPFSVAFSLRLDSIYEDVGLLLHCEEERLGTRGWSVRLDSNHVRVLIAHSWPSNAIEIRSKAPLEEGQWKDLIFTYDGSSKAGGLHLYLDGQLVDTEIVHDNLYKGITYVYDIHTYGFHGLGLNGSKVTAPVGAGIDELKIWSRDISREVDEKALAAVTELRRKLVELRDSIPEIMVMGDLPEPRPSFVLNRGVYDDPTTPVQPGAPESIHPYGEDLPKNRLGLARWLTDPDNPLPARVFVNRVWSLHFGRGLVATTEDFGNQGELPSHPALLDYLAQWFINHEWDVKALHRLILSSRTFQQASGASPELRERDPDNALLARGPSFRLPAEMIRDAALASSGLLTERVGGPSVMPYQPDGLWDELTDKSWAYRYTVAEDDDRYRRTLYTVRKRTAIHPNQLIFDGSDNSVCTVRRRNSNTPLQSLVLLNDPTYTEAADALAERIVAEGGTPAERIRRGFQALTGRPPDEREARLLMDYYVSKEDLSPVYHAVINSSDFYTLR